MLDDVCTVVYYKGEGNGKEELAANRNQDTECRTRMCDMQKLHWRCIRFVLFTFE